MCFIYLDTIRFYMSNMSAVANWEVSQLHTCGHNYVLLFGVIHLWCPQKKIGFL